MLVGEGRDLKHQSGWSRGESKAPGTFTQQRCFFLGVHQLWHTLRAGVSFFCHLGLKNEVCASDHYNVHRVC